MRVQMQLSRIVMIERRQQQVIYLKEVEGSREFPILIGEFEARSIDLRVHKEKPTRPQTHDLVLNVVAKMGGELDSVLITDLKEHTYFALLRVRRDDDVIEIDSRPSDAIAIAYTCDPPLPIYVNEAVLDAASES